MLRETLEDHLKPVYLYPDGKDENRELQENQKHLCYADHSGSMCCDVTDGDPVLPLKGHGELWHMGWDIATQWAIDGSGQAWKDGARVEISVLLADCETDSDWARIAKLAGMEVRSCKLCGRIWRDLSGLGAPCCAGRAALHEMLNGARRHIAQKHPLDALNLVETRIEDLLKLRG